MTDAESYWARYLGVTVAELRAPGVRFVPHAALASYRGLWVFRRGDACIVSAPAAFDARAALGSLDADALCEVAQLRAALGNDIDRVIGPSYHGWLPPSALRDANASGVRALEAVDRAALAALRAEVPAAEWEDSALPEAPDGLFGAFAPSDSARGDDRLVAAAGLRARGDDAGDVCVLVHPAHRARGLGAGVVRALCRNATARQKLVLYQTSLANEAAVAIADRVGFERFAIQLAVRLRQPSGLVRGDG